MKKSNLFIFYFVNYIYFLFFRSGVGKQNNSIQSGLVNWIQQNVMLDRTIINTNEHKMQVKDD